MGGSGIRLVTLFRHRDRRGSDRIRTFIPSQVVAPGYAGPLD